LGPQDSNQVLDQLDLRGQVRGLREWNEGYEDLKAIPFSFAVEFKGEREPWSMFSDSEEEKVCRVVSVACSSVGTDS
jgi:MAP7 domain-containing protein 1